MSKAVNLGVNIDHVATLRQARGGHYPSVVDAAELAVAAGAGGITMHLREDRRHIQDQDVRDVLASVRVPVNLEMAVTDEMLQIAADIRAQHCCLVPERREELTTEGGLDVVKHHARVRDAVGQLKNNGYQVSLFIDPETDQVQAACDTGAPVVELHTGAYSHARGNGIADELLRLKNAAVHAQELGLIVHAGHGLNAHNVGPVAALPPVVELNIGHSLVSRAIYIGLDQAIREILAVMQDARK